MSVSTWERNLSKSTFLWNAHKMNEELSKMMANVPRKYKNSYMDYIITSGLEVFRLLNLGNNILINDYTPDADFKERKKYFRSGIAELEILGSTLNIFLNHLEKCDDINKDTIYKYKESFGTMIDEVKRLTKGVIKYDEEKQADVKAKRQLNKR